VPLERGVVIEVRTELAAELPKVLGTESDIRDALTNLIFNAVDAMAEGGTLLLRTRPGPPLEEQGVEPAPSVQLEVADTGAGMDEQTRRRCLEPFFTTKGERGTGMGLSMVYGMVKRHGAQLEIDSTVGHGTTVRVCFIAAAAQGTAQGREQPTAPVRPLRLLVVDDEPLILQSLSQVLNNAGHTVVTVDGGQAGIEAFTAAHHDTGAFDLVITDLGMPYVDGRAVATAVKALSPSTPVVLLTGWGQRLSTEQSVPQHVDRLLSKPPKLSELHRALAELTTGRHSSTHA
jgi:CheY-like chemotaxis protein